MAIKKTNNNQPKPTGGTTVGTVNLSAASIGLPNIRSGGSSNIGVTILPYSGVSTFHSTTNLYPQFIAKYKAESPTNGAVLQRKALLVKGQGLDISALPMPIQSLLNNLNSKGQSIDDILELVTSDYTTYGGVSLKVRWGYNGKIVNIEHVNFGDVRIADEIDENGDYNKFVVSNNWMRDQPLKFVKEYTINRFNPSVFKDPIISVDGIPQPSETQLSNAEQLIYWFDPQQAASSGMYFYPVPDYASGFDNIGAEIEIGIANKSLLHNSFGAKTIIAHPYKPVTQEEQSEIDYSIKQSFVGSSNNGGVINVFSPNSQDLPTVIQIESVKADSYLALNERVKMDICTAHQIPLILAEVNMGGGFNNRAEEMKTAIQIFQQTYCKQKQQKLMQLFNKIMFYMGYPDVKLAITPFKLEIDSPQTQQTVSADNNSTSLKTN